jgi:hypothetical protein
MADGVVDFNALMMPDIAGSYMKGRQYRDQREEHAAQMRRQAQQDEQSRQEFDLRKQELGYRQEERQRQRPVDDAERLRVGMEIMAPFVQTIRTPEDLARAKTDPRFLKAFELNAQLTGDPTPIEAVTFDHIAAAQEQLRAMNPPKVQAVPLGGGGFATWEQGSDKLTVLREPTERAPTGYRYGEDGNLQIDPGYVAGQRQVAGARRAPPKAGGGHSGGGAPKLPTGFILD